jgi:hypothetical protein
VGGRAGARRGWTVGELEASRPTNQQHDTTHPNPPSTAHAPG